MSQRERVERLLRQRASRGITAADFLLPDIQDGGPPITRVAARVQELRDAGLSITTSGERDGFAVYVLHAQAPVEGEQDAPSRLFAGVEVGRGQRSAIYDSDMGEAA